MKTKDFYSLYDQMIRVYNSELSFNDKYDIIISNLYKQIENTEFDVDYIPIDLLKNPDDINNEFNIEDFE